MKRRAHENGEGSGDGLDALAQALSGLAEASAVKAFLQDLCTPAELEAMTDRWRVVPLLQQGMPYREIHDLTQVSVTTIGRVARTLEYGTGGYALASQPRASSSARETR
jgi:TrpR-related protein YerC/YecD